MNRNHAWQPDLKVREHERVAPRGIFPGSQVKCEAAKKRWGDASILLNVAQAFHDTSLHCCRNGCRVRKECGEVHADMNGIHRH